MAESLRLESFLTKLDMHFESARAECEKESQSQLEWLQQTVVNNKKSLLYQSCVQRLPACSA